MPKSRQLRICGEIWKYEGPAGWYFLRLTDEESAAVESIDDLEVVGLGYVKVTARLGETQWQTTLFPEKSGRYLLAFKAAVRKHEVIEVGEVVEVELEFA